MSTSDQTQLNNARKEYTRLESMYNFRLGDNGTGIWPLMVAQQKIIDAIEFKGTHEILCVDCGKSIGRTSCEITATSMHLCEPCQDQD